MKTVIPSNLLRIALTADAGASAALAALQLAAPHWLSQTLMLPRALLMETGVFLVLYTLLLVVLARSPRVWSGLIGIVVLGNIGWAAGCAARLVSGVVSPTALGVAFVALQALTVLLFAALEFFGLVASTPAQRLGTARA